MMDFVLLLAAATAHSADPTGQAANGPAPSIIKRLVQQKWDNDNAAAKLTGPTSQLQSITNSNCRLAFSVDKKQIFRCAYTITYRAPEGSEASFDASEHFEQVNGQWQISKIVMIPPVAPPPKPPRVSN